MDDSERLSSEMTHEAHGKAEELKQVRLEGRQVGLKSHCLEKEIKSISQRNNAQ